MARTLNYIVLLSIVAVIVAASGCTSTPTNNTQVPATPATTPATIKATPSETPSMPVETSVTPSTGETKNETPISGLNATPVEKGNLQITPIKNMTSTVSNGTNISTTERKLQIEQSNMGVKSTVSNGTVTVAVSKPSYGLATNPFSTAKKDTNPLNTTGNNAPVAVKSGTLKIIPSNGTTSTGNQTAIHLGTAQRNAPKIIAAQNATGSGSGEEQNVTGK